MKVQDLVRRADELIQLAQATLNTCPGRSLDALADSAKFGELRSAALSFIERTFGREHTYYKEFSDKCSDVTPYKVETGLGILKAIRDELAGGWIETTRGLLSAEVFADFLDMANHLLEEKYKDPSAVLVGGVVEEHLRQLAAAKGIPVEESRGGHMLPRKADALNADLTKAGVYNKLDQKQVTAWLDLRNKAAHAKYGEYGEEQVRLMLEGVRQFVARVRP